jgi:hypothetical protein
MHPNDFFKFRKHPRCRYIAGESAYPKVVINRKSITVVVVCFDCLDILILLTQTNFFFLQGKHLKNSALIPSRGYGEAQLAIEILAFGSENMR